MPRKTVFFPFLAVLLCASGCGDSKATVRGTVTYKNSPLTSGEVRFIGKSGTVPRAGLIGPDGRYEIIDAPVGEVQVTVVCIKSDGPLTQVNMGGKTADGKSVRKRDTKPSPRTSAIPTKYNDPKTSGLLFTITTGSQSIDIALKAE
jgi:hypothetical protein